MKKLRLDKYLADMQAGTRSEVKQMIRKGRVTVNGETVRRPEQKTDPEQDRVAVDGETVRYVAMEYWMLNKPQGVVSATEDRREKTVLSLLPDSARKDLFPVGRLDKDTEGLLLLTNEGGLAHDILSPKHHVDKVYYARTAGCLTEEDCRAFAAGMTLGGGLECLPAGLEILSAGPEGSEGLVTLREGKFHQVKRMLAARGKPVLYLKRVRMGNLPLDPALEPGTYRYLTEDEVESLRNF